MIFLLPYEKQVKSQHGEDGIIEQLVSSIKSPNKHFFEIGWGTGDSNMTLNLMLNHGWSGLGVDCQELNNDALIMFPPNFTYLQEFVFPDTCKKYLELVPIDCDFFSLDIDSFDYEVAKELFSNNFRPKTVCVEINKYFGANHYGSFPYKTPRKRLYHKIYRSGVSLQKYISFFKYYGYEYFGYDSSYTNAFFYHKDTCNSLEHLPKLSLKDFPYQDDSFIRNEVNKSFWKDKTHLIFQNSFIL